MSRLHAAARYGFLLLLALSGAASAIDEYAAARRDLIEALREESRRFGGRLGEFDAKVLAVLDKVPRHEFVPAYLRSQAYENRPLPIGFGQTISQPFIVALMTDLLDAGPSHRVLEIGTGSGYQAAVLAELAGQVYTVEIIPGLAEEAAARLQRLGYANLHTKVADGYYGWPDQAPFDAIIVTAAPTQIPPPLIQQLKPGGRMVIPVGSQFLTQYLLLVEKSPEGQITTREMLPVAFVPLTGSH